MEPVLIVVGLSAVLVIVLFVALSRQGNPEQPVPPDSTREPSAQPAEPGAEGMAVPEPGEVGPATEAGNDATPDQ